MVKNTILGQVVIRYGRIVGAWMYYRHFNLKVTCWLVGHKLYPRKVILNDLFPLGCKIT